jgi:hypothetical protein
VRAAKALSVGLVVLMIAGPLLAATSPRNRGDCRRMTRQIARYDRDAKWADQRGDQLWEQASKQRVAQLTERRNDRCPQYKKPNPLAQMADFIAAAAKAAAPYFIPGLGGL